MILLTDSDRERQILYALFYMRIHKKAEFHRNKEQNDNCQRQEVGKMGEDTQKIQTCYKQFLGV